VIGKKDGENKDIDYESVAMFLNSNQERARSAINLFIKITVYRIKKSASERTKVDGRK